jgi:starch synthase
MFDMQYKKTILMVAAENGALPNAKIGGIGDVVRDIPKALANKDCSVHVVIPAYGYLQTHAQELGAVFPVMFRGDVYQVKLWFFGECTYADGGRVTQWVIDHPEFAPCGVGQIYCDDGSDKPFASDANKYALFCAAVGQAIIDESFGALTTLHLHDWHAATLAVLREYDPHYRRLKPIHTVYSIHNLSLQGIRPFQGDASSLKSWFPYLPFDPAVICDPCATHCYNPMRAAINLANKVHAVSPTYAKEIQRPSHIEQCIYGGENLEVDIGAAEKQGRLFGILNGCEYSEEQVSKRCIKNDLVDRVEQSIVQWISQSSTMMSVHWVAQHRLSSWRDATKTQLLVTSVGRITEQKVRLLRHKIPYQGEIKSALEHMLDVMGDKGMFILLGSGDKRYEQFLLETSAKHKNFIFLRGFSEALAQAIYSSGDLFLMPSSYEPCGISQMLAMRGGQPCLVHGVGGLNDTVIDGVSGFVFYGQNGDDQGMQFIERFKTAMDLFSGNPKKYQAIAKAASKVRFSWATVADDYLQKLYC